MSIVHMVILAIIAIIVIPPDKLPEVARQVARFFNDIRRSTSGVWDDIKKDAMLKPEDLMKYNQPPKAFNPPDVSTEEKIETVVESENIHHGHGPESIPPTADVNETSTTKDENKKS